MSEVPDYVPMLIKGESASPEEGGCLVQIANWLVDPATWSDGDLCVHHTLTEPAIFINDTVDTDVRHSLAPLASALGGTKPTERGQEMELLAGLNAWKADNPQPMLDRIASVTKTTKDGLTIFLDAAPRYNDGGVAAVEWLYGLVAEANRILGREHRLLNEEEGLALKALMNQ